MGEALDQGEPGNYGDIMTRRKKPSGRTRKKPSMTITGVYCPQNGKVSYATEMVAKMALARLKSQRPDLNHVYQCLHPQCKQWHLTSQEPHNKKETA